MFYQRLIALLSTARFSNVPTIISHVYLAIISSLNHDIWQQILVVITIICCYLYGCLLGDYCDIGYDHEHRPQRPLVQGIISEKLVIISIITTLSIAVSGMLLLSTRTNINTSTASILFFALICCITCYAKYHKKLPWLALCLISCCRLLVLPLAYYLLLPQSISSTAIILLATSTAGYTLLLSIIAQKEHSAWQVKQSKIILAMFALLLLPLLPSIFYPLTSNWLFIICFSLYLCWISYALYLLIIRQQKKTFVGTTLQGLCLMDACLFYYITTSPNLPQISIFYLLFASIFVLRHWVKAT